MSRLLAVAARELRERWLLLPGALASGCFPIVLPAFGVERQVMPVVGFVGAVLLGLGAAVVVGSSMFARDAANGRLGFLFSRPVSWPAIWGGKWLAAVVLVVATSVLAMIPWMAVYSPDVAGGHHGSSWLRVIADSPGGAFFVVLLLLGIGFANFNGTLFRSRSAWLVFDFALLLVSIWATRRYVAPLWLYGIMRREADVTLALLPLAIGFLVGSVAQVVVGRTDIRRAHRALSVGFWAVVAASLAGAAGYWHWVRSAGPGDVTPHALSHDPAGRWAYVEASSRRGGWYPYGFLIDTASGHYTPRRDPGWDRYEASGVLFSRDGRVAAMLHPDGRGAALSLWDLGGTTPRLTEVALESSPPPGWSTAFALSPTASHAFVVHESGASIFDLPSGRRVATATIGPGWRPAAVRYPTEGGARAWLAPETRGVAARGRAEIRVVNLALDGAATAATFAAASVLGLAPPARDVVPDPEGRRIVTRDGGLHLRDGATGAPVATLAEDPGATAVLFLADGRILTGGSAGSAEPGPPRVLLRVFDPAGALLGEMSLDLVPGGLTLGPEMAPGRVAVSSFRVLSFPEETLVVDAGERRVVERLDGLRPATGFWDVSSAVPASAATTSVHFFRDLGGRVIRLDVATGERKVVAGPGAPAGERFSAR